MLPARRSCSLILLVVPVLFPAAAGRCDEWPELADDRLRLTLFAEEPDIATPIGMAIDERDRIFVVESHTHHPPADYAGPDSDRIKTFVDEDYDGRPERISIFADGIHQAMNLAFSPEGGLYVVCAREVLRLDDADGDGACDRRERILELLTLERYAHNSLLGITFDRDGWMYVSRGNAGSHRYLFRGKDETTVEGYGDGGNVIRCRADGTRLEEFATGFWNPFDLKLDRNGRLLLVDNDPDARGPNRLVHVVRYGDYGYKSVYGGGGNHPFQGWDGTLPGTLPFVAGTGEAPSGVLDCRRSSFPADYRRGVLATIWNENSIERYDLHPAGATLALTSKTRFMTGSQDFRPVALDCDSRGNLFITDWVLVSYPNHGRGRIWRVSCETGSDRLEPQPYLAPYLPDPTAGDRLAPATTDDPARLADALQSADAVVRHAARIRLAEPRFSSLRKSWAGHPDARLRLGVLLASRNDRDARVELIRGFLADPAEEVRRAALMWAGESLKLELRPHLEAALTREPVSATLFETYLAAVQNLDPDFVEQYGSREARRAQEIRRRLDPRVPLRVAKDDRYSEEVRAIAIRRLDDETVARSADWLFARVRSAGDPLALAAIQRLASAPGGAGDRLAAELTGVATDEARSPEVRCEALLALGLCRVGGARPFLPLLESPDADVAVEAARAFRAWLDAGLAADCIASIRGARLRDEVREPLSYALEGRLFQSSPAAGRPETSSAWREVLGAEGHPGRGRRVFFTARVGCADCHTVNGRGGVLGPDLGGVARSKTRTQIVDSILDPSAEFPPQYQAWTVITTDGQVHRGLQLDHKAQGAIALITETGENAYFKGDEILAYEASPSSLMPAGLSETMSVHEFRDLVAFLESLR